MQEHLKRIALNYKSPVKKGEDLNEWAENLFNKQRSGWPFLRENLEGLENIHVKEIDLGHISVKVQYNPNRIKSSSAKVDPESISKRRCFLCPEFLPRQQRGVLMNNNYLLLVNPYPIFPRHFTIPAIDHIPQSIADHFSDLLDISRMMSGYTVFYNGPRCGASAPDHMHFQAGNRGLLPIESEFSNLKGKYSDIVYSDGKVEVIAVKDYPGKFVSVESGSQEKIEVVFNALYKILEDGSEEPMINILVNYSEGKWRVIIFPRDKHRPRQFYEEADKRILISPASVDFGGVCITPRKEDFERIDSVSLKSIFDQVSVSEEGFRSLILQLKNILSIKW